MQRTEPSFGASPHHSLINVIYAQSNLHSPYSPVIRSYLRDLLACTMVVSLRTIWVSLYPNTDSRSSCWRTPLYFHVVYVQSSFYELRPILHRFCRMYTVSFHHLMKEGSRGIMEAIHRIEVDNQSRKSPANHVKVWV